MGTPLPQVSLFRITPQEVEVQGSEGQRPHGDQSRSEGQQPTLHCIQRGLEAPRPQRSRDVADVVVGKPIRGRHEQYPAHC